MAKTNQSAERFNESIFLRAEDVQKIMQCSRASAYRIIQQLNKELEAKGKITVRGRVSKKYFMERIYG